jgi:hydrogenase/urease accessory protein HupE
LRCWRWHCTPDSGGPHPAPALSLLIVGVLVAADLRMPADAVSILAVAIGLVHGFFNDAALGEGVGTLGLLGWSLR